MKRLGHAALRRCRRDRLASNRSDTKRWRSSCRLRCRASCDSSDKDRSRYGISANAINEGIAFTAWTGDARWCRVKAWRQVKVAVATLDFPATYELGGWWLSPRSPSTSRLRPTASRGSPFQMERILVISLGPRGLAPATRHPSVGPRKASCEQVFRGF